MKRLVYNGTRFAFIDTPDIPAPQLLATPRAPQRAAFGHRGMPYRLREFRPIGNGNGYRPGPLIDLGPDQCRYSIREGVMCGAKGYPYCEHHHGVCHTGKVAWNSARMKGLANGTRKEGWGK